MQYTEEMLTHLRNRVSTKMSKKRFIHTLGVEDTANELGEIFLSDKVTELRAAALLHDVAKELPTNELENLLKNTTTLTDEDLSIPEAYHSLLAPEIILKDFNEYATEEILSAVRDHTLGSPDMDLFSMIIFVSDYIEPNREYDHCIKVRKYLLSHLSKDGSDEMNFKTIVLACLMVIEFTEEFLKRREKRLHSRTLLTKKYLLSLI